MIKTTKKTPPSVPTIIATKLTGNRKIEVESVNEKKKERKMERKRPESLGGFSTCWSMATKNKKKEKMSILMKKKKRRKVNLKVF